MVCEANSSPVTGILEEIDSKIATLPLAEKVASPLPGRAAKCAAGPLQQKVVGQYLGEICWEYLLSLYYLAL